MKRHQLVISEDALMAAQRRGVRAFLETIEAEVQKAGVYVELARLNYLATGQIERLTDLQLNELHRDVQAEVRRRAEAVVA